MAGETVIRRFKRQPTQNSPGYVFGEIASRSIQVAMFPDVVGICGFAEAMRELLNFPLESDFAEAERRRYMDNMLAASPETFEIIADEDTVGVRDFKTDYHLKDRRGFMFLTDVSVLYFVDIEKYDTYTVHGRLGEDSE